MELRHLRYFVGVADAASFSRAATRLNVTQPALSRQIRDLEQELGVRLFDRAGRRVRLTPEGEDLVRRTRDALVIVEALRERARSLGSGHAGILRVGASPQVLESVLAGFLTRYRRANPSVDVQLVEEGAIRVLDLVEQGQVQVGLSTLPVREPLRARVLFPARVLAVIPRSSRLRPAPTVDLADLANEPLLLLRSGFATRQILDGAFQAARLRHHIALESGDPHCLLTLAEAGHGAAVVPSTVLLPPGHFWVAPIVHRTTALGFWSVVCWDPRRFLPPYGERFIEGLVDYTRQHYPGKRFDRVAPLAPPSPSPAPRARPAADRRRAAASPLP